MKLVPVDHDPFAPQSDLQKQVADFPQRAADMVISALGPIGEAGMTIGDWLRTGHVDARDIAPVVGNVMLGVATPPAARAEAPAAELAMDEASRLARAHDLGFRSDMPLYHGSGSDFSAFRAVPTTAPGTATPGVSAALDPIVANEFAERSLKQRGNAQASQWPEGTQGAPQVYPLWHRADKPAVLTLDGSESHAEVVGALRDAFDGGHDAVMLKNYTTPAGEGPHRIIIVRDANQLRSPFAAFDPAKKFSPDLLAGLAGIGAVPIATLMPVDHDPFHGSGY